jgi:hypothetical protein
MSDPTEVHIPRLPDVPERVHRAVVEQVEGSIAARQTAAQAITSALPAWEREVLGPPPTPGDAEGATARLERSGLSPEAYRAVASAGRQQWLDRVAEPLGRAAATDGLPDRSIIIQAPSTYRAPYMGSAFWQTISGTGFQVEEATAFPSQPNGQPRVFDPTTGLVGTGLAVENDGGFGNFSITVNEYEMVGVWAKTHSAGQFLSATVTPSAVEFGSATSLLPVLGGGSAALTSGTMIECFTGSQSASQGDFSSVTTAATWSPNNLNDNETHSASPPPQNPTLAIRSLYAPGTWIWVLAGTWQQIRVSLTDPVKCHLSVFDTMTVSSLSLWL